MKDILIKLNIIIILFTIIALHSNYTFALDTKIDNIASSGEFDPLKNKGDSEEVTNIITNLIKNVLPMIRFFGGLVMVISLGIFGLYRVLSSDSGAELSRDFGFTNILTTKNSKILMDTFRAVIIGSILLFSSTVIVEFILKLFIE